MSASAVRAVVDSNLLVRGVLGRRPTSVAVQLHRAILLRRFRLVISDYILEEVRDVLASPELKESGAPTARVIDRILNALRLSAHVVPGAFEVNLVPADPKDNPIVACALEGDAEYIVTDDRRHLLPLGTVRVAGYRPVRVVSAFDFLRRESIG